MGFYKKYFKNLDYLMIIIILGIAVFSYFGISSAKPESTYAMKQLIFYGVGFAVLIILQFIDSEVIKQYSYFLYGLGLILLIGLFFLADEKKGMIGWYEVFGFGFQPSEVMKIFMILTLAKYLDKREERPFNSFFELYPIFLIIGVPLLLIILQPDLGTALVFIIIMLCMMLVYGVKLRYFAILSGIVSIGISVLYILYSYKNEFFDKLVPEHQLNRLISFIDPSKDPLGTGYQVTQSIIAVGSGQLHGVGLYQGTQGKNNWVPESHNDFIFSVIAEEHGFIGASILLLLLFFLIYRIVRIGIKSTDVYGAYVSAGMVGMLIFTIFENVGMTIGIMPITGIPLPFVSYGGSSLLTNFISIGIILNLGRRREDLMFE